VLPAIDKLDRLGVDGVRCALLGEGRKDERRRFPSGAGLDDARPTSLMGFNGCGRNAALRAVARLVANLSLDQAWV